MQLFKHQLLLFFLLPEFVYIMPSQSYPSVIKCTTHYTQFSRRNKKTSLLILLFLSFCTKNAQFRITNRLHESKQTKTVSIHRYFLSDEVLLLLSMVELFSGITSKCRCRNVCTPVKCCRREYKEGEREKALG